MPLEQRIGTALLHVESDVGDGHGGFAQWCDDHDRELMARDGYLSIRRFEVAPLAYASPQGARYLTMYELSNAHGGQAPALSGVPDTGPDRRLCASGRTLDPLGRVVAAPHHWRSALPPGVPFGWRSGPGG